MSTSNTRAELNSAAKRSDRESNPAPRMTTCSRPRRASCRRTASKYCVRALKYPTAPGNPLSSIRTARRGHRPSTRCQGKATRSARLSALAASPAIRRPSARVHAVRYAVPATFFLARSWLMSPGYQVIDMLAASDPFSVRHRELAASRQRVGVVVVSHGGPYDLERVPSSVRRVDPRPSSFPRHQLVSQEVVLKSLYEHRRDVFDVARSSPHVVVLQHADDLVIGLSAVDHLQPTDDPDSD